MAPTRNAPKHISWISKGPGGVIAVADPVERTAPAALDSLRADGVRIVMPTGDNRKTAEAAARKLGIQEVEADVLPAAMTRLRGVSSETETFICLNNYDHGAEDAFSRQNYFPDGMERAAFYQPRDRGFEREIGRRLEYWAQLRSERSQG